ncbi:hypothetical protein EYR40_008022 [Pleurotus pulmonarius]|nr:hypothetical protein EYR40_008022 [Pleurotus pulmonarius]
MANSSLSILLPLLGVTFWLVLRRKRVNRLYPPGPPSWPIIGNLSRLPAKHPWISFTQWKETYGSMLYFRGLGVSILVLNDVKLVTELFEKRPGIYSNRPRFTVAGDLLGIDESMPLRLHDRGWKLQRKLARTAMSPDAVKQYHPLLEDIAALLSESLRETPEAFGVHIRLFVLPSFFMHYLTTVDNEVTPFSLPDRSLTVDKVRGASRRGSEGDFEGHKSRQTVQSVKKQIAEGRTLPSLAHNLLANEGGKEFTTRREYEDAVKWLTAGVESTTALVSTTLLALAMNPDKQERAQKEIDDVIGSNRLPTLDDKDSLPYVGALIKESMRWHPPIPLSLGRQTSHDDICEGYFIPAGTIVLPNIWAIARDGGGKYPSEEFVPERFLDVDPPKDPSSYAFGCGRRICPAIQFVERSTFIFVASILAAFNTCPKVDNNGNPIPYDAQFSSSLVSYVSVGPTIQVLVIYPSNSTVGQSALLVMTMNKDFLVIGALSVAACLLWFCERSSQRKYPPGPPGWPFVGNLLKLPKIQPWHLLTEWKHAYGNIFRLHGLGISIVVLGDMKVIKELLDTRGSTYSHRPVLTVAGDLLDLNKSFALQPYNDDWKLRRKLARVALSPGAIKRYHPLQEDIAALLNEALLDTPESAAGRLILSITYGIPISSLDDEFIALSEEAMSAISRVTVPGTYLADMFSSLKCLHAWVFRDQVKRDKTVIQDFVNRPFHHVQKQMTFSVVLTLILALTLYPEKQVRAHAEIDATVGTGRLPTLDDKGSLPYVEALIKESIRWHPAVPLSLARRSAQDDVYAGHFIPEGAIVIPNIWAIARDCNDQYSPSQFIPERFLDENAPIDPADYSFGFGRRICPGKHLAENSVFLFVASILAAFEISAETDLEGNPIPLVADFSSGVVSSPNPFKCKISPRSADRSSQVRDRAGAASHYLHPGT